MARGGVAWLVIVVFVLATAVAVPFLIRTPRTAGYRHGMSIFVVSLAL
jgi:hypothetical protein